VVEEESIAIGERRKVEENVVFEPSDTEGGKKEKIYAKK